MNFQTDAETLRTAMKGTGTDEKTISTITIKRNNAQRQQIREAYKSCYGRDLIEDFEDELSGNYKNTIIGMWKSPLEYDVDELRVAFEGAGTDDETVIEIIGSRSNKRLGDIKAFYEKKYFETLESRIKDETSGDFEKLLISLIQCKRDESNHVNKALAEKEADELYKAGEGKWGTDDEVFNRIFALRSPAHLYAINEFYINKYGKSLKDVVESEFSGNVKVLLKAIVHAHIDPADYFAERINKACKGWGTNDKLLIRELITTDEEIMVQVKNAYKKRFGKTLEFEIEEECSGDYKDLLLEIVKN
jgi:annexin A7/11